MGHWSLQAFVCLLPAPLSHKPCCFVTEETLAPCSLQILNLARCTEQRLALASQDGVTWKQTARGPPLASAGSPFIETSSLLPRGTQRIPSPEENKKSLEMFSLLGGRVWSEGRMTNLSQLLMPRPPPPACLKPSAVSLLLVDPSLTELACAHPLSLGSPPLQPDPLSVCSHGSLTLPANEETRTPVKCFQENSLSE